MKEFVVSNCKRSATDLAEDEEHYGQRAALTICLSKLQRNEDFFPEVLVQIKSKDEGNIKTTSSTLYLFKRCVRAGRILKGGILKSSNK